MLHLEFSIYHPLPVEAYPPYRCTCAYPYRCPGCRIDGAGAIISHERGHMKRWPDAVRATIGHDDEVTDAWSMELAHIPAKSFAQRRQEVRACVQRWLELYGQYPITADVYPTNRLPTIPEGWFSGQLVYIVYTGFPLLYADCVLHGVGTAALAADALARVEERRIQGRFGTRRRENHVPR